MFPDKYPPMLQNDVDPGEPLFLTPYVEKGQFDMGKSKYDNQILFKGKKACSLFNFNEKVEVSSRV
jgi:hypothetical protein